MKSLVRWFVFLALLAADAAAGEAALSLTMEEAVRLALANNPGIRAAAARLEQARQNEEIVASPARPQATLNLRRDDQHTAFGPPFKTSLGPLPVSIQAEPLEYSTSFVGVKFRQLLFDGGRIAAQIEQARAGTEGVEQSLLAGYNDLVLEVRLAYLDALQARHQEAEALERLELARSQLRETEARYDAGSSARADVVYAQLPVSQAELALARLRHTIETSRSRLNKTMGLPQETLLDPAEPDPPGPLAGDLTHYLESATTTRPEVARIVRELSAARSGVQAAARENRPQLYAFGELSGVGYNEDILPKSEAWQVGVEVSWPLLDGRRAAYLQKQAQGKVAELEALLEEQTQQVQFQVREAYGQVDTAVRACEAARVQVERAREALDMARGQYGAGVAPFLQVSQAQLEFSQARMDRLEALYDYHRARARLEWTAGIR